MRRRLAVPLIAIAAGGRSRRMGSDKARLAVAGERLLERVVRAAAPRGDVVVVGRVRPDDWDGPDARFVLDDRPDIGPAGALMTALDIHQGPVLLLACDLPALSVETVRWLANAERGPDGMVPRVVDALQPLAGVYTQRCRAALLARIDAGRFSLRDLVRRGEFATPEVPAELVPSFVDVDTPDDLTRSRRAAR